MACCLTAPSHYINQCWPNINKVQWHASEHNCTRNNSAPNHYNYLKNVLPKISFKSPRRQWVKRGAIDTKSLQSIWNGHNDPCTDAFSIWNISYKIWNSSKTLSESAIYITQMMILVDLLTWLQICIYTRALWSCSELGLLMYQMVHWYDAEDHI